MNRLIHEEANREFREALDYYLAIGPELGARFYREMDFDPSTDSRPARIRGAGGTQTHSGRGRCSGGPGSACQSSNFASRK